MYVEREVTGEFETEARLNNIVVLVGPRQAGKTTFLKEQSKRKSLSYVLFDDPDVKELFDSDIKRFENQYLSDSGITVLDEVQYGKDPGKKLKYFADIGKKIWVTSSSKMTLDKEVLSWLVGRVGIIRLYQFSLNEFLLANGQKEVTGKILLRQIEQHMIYGGYPKVVIEQDKSAKELILRDLYQTMVLKDMARMFMIEDINALERLAAYLSHYIGNVLIYENIGKDLGISFQSVKKYIEAMEKSYLVVRILPLYKNKLKEITKQPKLYFVDTGLRNLVAGEFDLNVETKGKLFENYLLSELLKVGENVKYWQSKSKAEVDFVLQRGNELIPIEVKLKARDGQIERSMHSFIDLYRPKKGFVVFSEGIKSSARVGKCTIRFVDIPNLLIMLGHRPAR